MHVYAPPPPIVISCTFINDECPYLYTETPKFSVAIFVQDLPITEKGVTVILQSGTYKYNIPTQFMP